ncbi:hypothetical protein V6U78_00635 [Marinospirillum sp. MEB164]|uniref:Molecular chaperone n=1 Tax=Marinospirillum alkalitolerans TaxID=3123374 RepID=A0ABW8PTE6_9GAMM
MTLIPVALPPLVLTQLSDLESNFAALQTWLAEQPLAYPQGVAPALAGLLTELNQLQLAAPERVRWLDALRHTSQQLLPLLTRAKDAAVAQRLEQGLLTGYQRAVNDLLAMRHQLAARELAQLLLPSLYRCLELPKSLLVRSCLHALPLSDAFWQELQVFYQLACQSRLQNHSVQTSAPASCEAAYIHLLVLGLIQPENLRADELLVAVDWLGRATPLIKMTQPVQAEAVFVALAQEGYRPQRRVMVQPEKGYQLQTEALAALLARHLSQEAHEGRLPARVQQHLCACLSPPTERGAPRLSVTGVLEISLGWRATHLCWQDQAPSAPALSPKKTNPFLALALDDDDPWGAAADVAEAGFATGTSTLNWVKEGQPEAPSAQAAQLHLVHKSNTSATGYGLIWPSGDSPALLRSGELVGVKEAEGWQLGVIRWVKPRTQHQEFGVELLTSRAVACEIKPARSFDQAVSWQPGFLIPALPVLGIAASVLAPRLSFHEGMRIQLQQPQGQQKAQLVELLRAYGEFNQFRLDHLSQPMRIGLV